MPACLSLCLSTKAEEIRFKRSLSAASTRRFYFMAASAHVSKVRSLYKRILVLHRFLPIDLRALGDQYVKDEFRRHKSAAPEEVKSFMTEWQQYKDTLQTQVLESAENQLRSVKFGADLSEGKLGDFQEEQVGQLYELMLESTKPNRQFDIQEDGK